jgi:iron complex transport system substrate-binding protein
MKNKAIALMGAIVLCSLFLVALPATAIATEQDDYVLGIYGNANEDDTIDMRDLTYVKLIFFGEKPETELADAKYDGKINPLDFIQIKLIIVGKEKELTIIDQADRTVTVNKPIKAIVSCGPGVSQTLRTLKAKDRIVGVSTYETQMNVLFPELRKLPATTTAAGHYDLDYEKIYELDPDIFIIYAPTSEYLPKFQEIVDKLDLTGIKVLGLTFFDPATVVENTEKLGYILGKREEAEEFIDWYEGYLNKIEEKVEGLSPDDKPRVFYQYYREYLTCTRDTPSHNLIAGAGGINIATDLPGRYPTVDPEWVMEQNPEIIVRVTWDGQASCGYDEDDPTEMKALRDVIMNRPELANVTAVKTGRVYVYSVEMGESLQVFIGIGYMAKWFHPTLFEDLNPKTIHQEYLTRFQGLDYDLDKHGVFVYLEEPE